MSNRRRLTEAEIQELRARLVERCDDIAISYWGEPLVRNRKEMRWGSGTGSLKLTLWPPRERGLWYDHDGSGGGDMLAMCRQENGGDWHRGLEDGCRRVGYHPPSWDETFTEDQREIRLRILEADAQRRAEARARAQAEAEAKAQSRGAGDYASRIYKEAGPIGGTLAERYLREVRGLGDLLLPKELKFHPGVWCDETKSKHPALVVVCGINGKLARIQAVLLDPATGKKAAVKSAKLTFGADMGHVPASFGPWNTGEPQLQLLTEGPEDAIVLNTVTGWRSD